MMASAIRIVLLVDQLGEGGAQRSATLVAAELHELGHKVDMVSARGGPYASELPEALRVHLLAPRWPRFSGVARFVVALCRTTRHHGTEVILTNGFAVTRLTLLLRASSPLGLSRRTRVVVVERSTLSLKLRHRFPNRIVRLASVELTRWLYRHADAIVGVSEGVSRDLEHTLGLPAGSVITIHNPIDTGSITRAIDGRVAEELERAFGALPRPIVMTTGRLVRAKAHHDLLEAFAGLLDDHRGSLVILGEGPLRSDLEVQATRLGIRDRVWMPGFVDNPWWFIARSDVFALSSHWEGFGRVLVEALACGVPVVSTDCPSGPREILEGIPGTRLTPVGDTRALSEAISESLRDRDRVDMSQIDLSPYEPSHVAAQYTAVVNALPTR